MEDNLKDIFKKELERELDKSYTEYIEKKCNDLATELELQRNKILTNLLDTISIQTGKDLFSDRYNFNIRIEKKYILNSYEN